MTDTRKISICIPTYNRVDMTLGSFKEVYDDERVSEIVIVDDASDLELFNQLKEKCDKLSKVSLYRNVTNADCFRNKMYSVSYAKNKWVVLLDSDNKISKQYIDKLYDIENWEDGFIYTPDFAAPMFDFRAYSGLEITKQNVAEYIDKPLFETMLNAANYFLPQQEWLFWWDGTGVDPVTSDSIFVCYKWLAVGNKIKVVEGLEYFHRVEGHKEEDSHYRKNVNRTTPGYHESILQRIRNLK